MAQRLLTVGGDERALRMLPLLRAQGCDVRSLGLAQEEWSISGAAWADALLFPYPLSVRNGMVPTLNGTTLYPQDVLAEAKNGALVLAGGALDALVDEANAKGKGLRLLHYGDSETFLRANAEISAEATVYEVMKRMPEALPEVCALIVGYGRYGRATAQKLNALQMPVIVAARSERQRLIARSDGMRAVALCDIVSIAPEIRVVLNTVPACVLSAAELAAFGRDCLLLELASAPYGFDPLEAEGFGLRCERLPALPARYAPQSAAKALAQACVFLLKEAQA